MKKPRVLLYDIETSPNIGLAFGIWEQNIPKVIKHWEVLCFGYKWLGEKKVHIVSQEGDKDDKKVVAKLVELFNQADVIIAHNGDSFDQKMVNTRILMHGLKPPMPYKTIDTKRVSKRYFRFNSNSLDNLARDMGIGKKLEHEGIELWWGCMNGDKQCWKRMKNYNKQDVVLLEEYYNIVRPWISNHPALNVLAHRPASCPKCLGENINAGMKYRATNTNLYQYFRCMDCGGTMKERIPEKMAKELKPVYTN